MNSQHTPVLLDEVLKYLEPKPNQNFIDATIGGGGHAFPILERIKPNGKVLGIEWDPKALERLKLQITNYKLRNNLILINGNFKNLKKIYGKYFSYKLNGVLFDLGLSLDQLQDKDRGFSFQINGPLDMRFNKIDSEGLNTAQILNSYSQEEIYQILKNYSKEPHARRLAQEIILRRKKRPFKTTFDLVELILEICQRTKKPFGKTQGRQKRRKTKIHPATLTFQALRIAVNDELNNLKEALPQTLEILEKKGRILVISFHSLEDRIVKIFFKENFKSGRLKILTKKPIRPSEEEVKINPRSRSAKLRVAEKI